MAKYNMKNALAMLLLAASSSAFTPNLQSSRASFGIASNSNQFKTNTIELQMAEEGNKEEEPAMTVGEQRQLLRLRKKTGTDLNDIAQLDAMSLEEEVELMTAEMLKKEEKMSNLKNDKGQEYAPWLKMGPKEESMLRAMAMEKAAARRKRREQEMNVSGALYMDSQAQELGGQGLKYNMVGDEVELEWSTSAERNTRGYILSRRDARTESFQVLADYESWGPLMSKGAQGGTYRFLDDSAVLGKSYVYRVTEVDNNDCRSDVSQCLVETQTKEEEQGTLIAAVGIVVLGIVAIGAGLVMDPYAV